MPSINWLHELVDIPKKLDPLADVIIDRFNGAIAWQSAEMVNGKSLKTVLEQCWEQQNGLLSKADSERAEALGVDAVINITALKCSIANAYLTDALASGSTALPWLILPTPRPELSPRGRDEALQVMKMAMQDPNIQLDADGLVIFAKEIKKAMLKKDKEIADKAANAMTSLIEDQCAEGGFYTALNDFLQYFPVYPFAVMAGPFITAAPRLVWGRNKPRLQTEVFPVFRAISPFDFVYSSDSPDTQRGTCVFTRTLWTRKQLLDAVKSQGYIKDNVMQVLEEADTNTFFNLSWLSHEPDRVDRALGSWSSNVAPLEILTHYGVMSGRELSKYGFNDLVDYEFYNAEIVMAGYKVIRVHVNKDPKLQHRPIHTASFYRTGGDRIAGDGIAQRLRDVERAYLACLRYLMRNAHFASAPLCEADYRRITKYMGEDDIGKVVPGLMYLVDGDNGSNKPVINFTSIPANLPAYAQLLEMFMQLADRVTNIPAALHGEAVGSGAMRTFRGMSMLQGNATKALHAAVNNIANGVFTNIGDYMYNMNMLFANDPDIQGDSQIITKGAEGLLQKEVEKQTSMELLQLIGAVGAQLQGIANVAPLVEWSIKRLVSSMGVPDEVIDQMESQPAQVPPNMQQGGGGAFGGIPNGNPESPEGAGIIQDAQQF